MAAPSPSNPGDYRTYLQSLLSQKSDNASKTAMAKVFGCGLVTISTLTDAEYTEILKNAFREIGGTVATYVEYVENTWHAVAVVDSCQKKARLSFNGQRMTANNKELTLTSDASILFRVSSWITRSVFGLKDKNPFPLLHCQFAFQNHPRSLCYDHESTMAQALDQMDLIITDTANHSREFDSTEATIVDILHCFGVIYVGSVNEVKSEAEMWSLNRAIIHSHLEGYTHLWWIEDSTLFEDDQYNLVIRFSRGDKPYYIKRKMELSGVSRFQDKVTGRKSCALEWELGENQVGFHRMNAWVETFLPRKSRAMPYMRHEIVHRYGFVKPSAFDHLIRPFLVKGVEGTLPTLYNSDLPPRLFYSPDLFVEKSKIPSDLCPSTVHFQIDVKPWIETCDLQMYVQVEGDAKHAYRVLHHKEGVFLPEPGQLKAFVESDDPDTLGEDALQMVVLKRTLAPCGAITIEFILTTHLKPFRIYVDNQLCDYKLRYTIFPYCPSIAPQVFLAKELLVFTKKLTHVQQKEGYPSLDAALPKTLQLIEKEGPQRIPLLFAFSNSDKNTYSMEMI